jgi:hypothetical protein
MTNLRIPDFRELNSKNGQYKINEIGIAGSFQLAILAQSDTVSSDGAESETELSTKHSLLDSSSEDQSVTAKLKWKEIKGAISYQIMISKSK